MPSFTHRQRKFVVAYFACTNAKEAAKTAGYSPRTAMQQGSHLLALPHIKKALERLAKKAECEAIATKKEILSHLTLIMRANLGEHVTTDGRIGASKLDSPAVQEFSQGSEGDRKIKLKDSLGAAREIAKLQGYYPSEKVETEHSGQVTYTFVNAAETVQAEDA